MAGAIVTILICIACFIGGYICSGLLSVIIMEKIGYSLSLDSLVCEIQESKMTRIRPDEIVMRKAIASNMNFRTSFIFATYVPIMIILAAFCAMNFRQDTRVMLSLFAALIGVAINGAWAIMTELSYWPQIVRFTGFNRQEKEVCYKILSEEDDLDDDECSMNIENIDDYVDYLHEGDILVILVPPAGDIIFSKIM